MPVANELGGECLSDVLECVNYVPGCAYVPRRALFEAVCVVHFATRKLCSQWCVWTTLLHMSGAFCSSLRMAATSLLSSTPAFERQCSRVGLSEPWVTALKAKQVDTLSKLSYAVTLPGVQATDADIDAFANKLRPGESLSLGDTAALKRLIFEAQTLSVAELRASVQSGDDVPKKLPSAERTLRLEQQKARLIGLPLEKGQWQVAHSLYDRYASMRESEELKYIPPSECVTRDSELAGAKPSKTLQIDASRSNLVFKDEEMVHEMSLVSDLELYQAMLRRALALDLVGLASFSTVQRWVERLFEIATQDPPPAFMRVSRAQILRADRQAFVEMAREHNGALKARPDGSLPLDDAFKNLPHNTEVMYFLLPVAAGKSQNKGNKGKGDKRKSSFKDEDGAKKKGKISRDPIPAELKGCHSRTPKNEPICFNFNLGRCKNKKCKFRHVCCKPGCYGKHPISQCPKKDAKEAGVRVEDDSE